MSALELTDDQKRALWEAMVAAGMECHRGQVMEVVYPLVRDMVLEEAARALDEEKTESGWAFGAAGIVRTMKGKR